ncbi:hypothetical protein HAL07_01400 [Helicobacter ailurogastricus]|uniref:Uncharacterized protein n=1 Tax=Helicobacter ailurogastricus TaxID=1578720 RepID=A0A0K2Y2F9_9HELI|nr:hypothetical protein HAL07_01400 [Helicobacter ailurogastricus]
MHMDVKNVPKLFTCMCLKPFKPAANHAHKGICVRAQHVNKLCPTCE